ncbi:acyl-CoA synthetase [Amycolatopsis sp. GA6-003]|uniref:acyl-CoA synthetase n=1 Tax=Amycolatopsis sp. GA6-003 TaxID=2652444 RepID=UPI0039170101
MGLDRAHDGVGAWPRRRARAAPRATAFRCGELVLTYRDVHERTSRLAGALSAAGVSAGDRVAYLGPNHPAAPELLFASGLLGAAYLPLNFRLSADELEFILDDAAPEVLVWHEQFDVLAAEVLARVDVAHRVRVGGAADDAAAYEELVLSADGPVPQSRARPGDVAMIQYTSGTSGRPKGVMLTHDNLVWNAINLLLDVDLRTDDVSLVAAPLFHTAGLNNHLLPTFLKGGAAVIMSAWNPAEALSLIAEHRVTTLLGVPAMLQSLTQAPGWARADLSSLRTIMCGGSPVPSALAEQFRERGLVFQPGYGMTEVSPSATFLRAGMAGEKAASVGAPSFFVDMKAVDEQLREVPTGERGELLVRGPNVTRGYWNLPDATAAAIDPDGWFRTGDIGAFDDDGYVYLKDRLKDMIISGGENISPAEVENALYEHPAVAECAVIGVSDRVWGEVGLACVVVRPEHVATADELEEHLRGRIAHYKVPKHYRLVERLPRNAAGKVLKPQLRARYQAESAT